MYSKEQIKELKKEFWITFSEQYPQKWMLYDTKIKYFSFKFVLDKKKIEVELAIEHPDKVLRKIYFQKIESLRNILKEEYLPEVQFDEYYQQDNNKIISRVWVDKTGLNYHDKAQWPDIFSFFYEKMEAFETFFYEYEDYIKDLEINS